MLHASDFVSNLSRRKASISPSLAFPIKEDYWPLLAVKLIFAAATYVAAVGSVILVGHLGIQWGSPPSTHPSLFECLFAVFAVFFGACLSGGAVAITCIFVIPLASWISSKAGIIRPGQAVASVVAAFVWSPLWVMSVERDGMRALPLLLLYTVPFALWLQAAGALAAPGDLVRSAHQVLSRTTIGRLLQLVTAVSIGGAIGSNSRSGLGFVLLIGTLATSHLLGRWPIEKAGGWLLSRRYARRHKQRRAARST